MKVEMRALDTIKPYEKNAKKHDQTQIDNVAESIRQYGFVQPIVVDKDGIIVIGHCRALGAKKLGLKEVPCVCVDDLTPEQVNALRIVDNKTNESDWDLDLLEQELPEVDLSDFCFQFDFLHKCDYNFISDETATQKNLWLISLSFLRFLCLIQGKGIGKIEKERGKANAILLNLTQEMKAYLAMGFALWHKNIPAVNL